MDPVDTVTVATAVTLPLLFVAVKVYGVVPAGATAMDPEAATAPMPSLMETDVAFVVVHVRVDVPPAAIVVGRAESVAVGVAAGAETVTVATAVTLPPLFVAVKVYGVVPAGATAMDPEAGTVPMPSLMETDVAFVVVHVRVDVPPAAIVVGRAESVAVGAAGSAETVTVATAVTLPLLFVAVKVYGVVPEGATAMDPEAATAPIPSLIETEVAPVVVQVSVAGVPAVTVDGKAVREAVGADIPGVVEELPPQPAINPVQRHIAMKE